MSLLSLGREFVIMEELFLWLFPSTPGMSVMYIKSVLSLRLILKRRAVRVIIIIIQQLSMFIAKHGEFLGQAALP